MTLCIGIYAIEAIYDDDPILQDIIYCDNWEEFGEKMEWYFKDMKAGCLTWEFD